MSDRATVTTVGPDERGFSQAVRLGDLLFVSGQVAWDDAGRVVGADDIRQQIRQAFANLTKALEAGGSALGLVGKLTIFATSREHLAVLREVRHEIFDPIGHYPASTFVVVSGLAVPELLVEIEAIALTR